jgi:hypothetical protein
MPMLECEEEIRRTVDEAVRLATRESLERFDSDGAPILVGGVKLTSKGPVDNVNQSPYGECVVAMHVHPSKQRGRANLLPAGSTGANCRKHDSAFRENLLLKYASTSSTTAQMDLSQNHGRDVSRCYLQDLAEAVGAIAQDNEERWEYADPEPPVAVGVDGACMYYCDEGWR